VNLVAIFSQRFAKFRGDHTTAPKGWITHNTNFHASEAQGPGTVLDVNNKLTQKESRLRSRKEEPNTQA
jgi:hypothetical protein